MSRKLAVATNEAGRALRAARRYRDAAWPGMQCTLFVEHLGRHRASATAMIHAADDTPIKHVCRHGPRLSLALESLAAHADKLTAARLYELRARLAVINAVILRDAPCIGRGEGAR